MSAQRSLRGTGGPKFCWICSRQLQRAPGRNQFYFWLVFNPRDPEPKYRVHADCVQTAIQHGNKVYWPETET